MNRRNLFQMAFGAICAAFARPLPALGSAKSAGAVVSFYKDAVDIQIISGGTYEVPYWIAGRPGRITVRNTSDDYALVCSARYFSITLKPREMLQL